MKKISIIVPAYNAVEYLPRCIKSLVLQQDLPYDDYEVIIINDGSTDDTLRVAGILQDRISADIKVVTTENAGLGEARNRGIAEASGKYLLFVDSDDEIERYVLGRIYEEMEYLELDMLAMNYGYYDSNGCSLDTPFKMDGIPRSITDGRSYLLSGRYLPMVWSYAFRRDFLVENQLKMALRWSEDEEFTPRAIYSAKRIKYLPLLFYRYYRNDSSFTQDSNITRGVTYTLKAAASLKKFRNEKVDGDDCRRYFDNRVAWLSMYALKRALRSGNTDMEAVVGEMANNGLLPLNPHYGKDCFYFKLLNFSPSLFVRFYRLVH